MTRNKRPLRFGFLSSVLLLPLCMASILSAQSLAAE
jgi:hypothetical protein